MACNASIFLEIKQLKIFERDVGLYCCKLTKRQKFWPEVNILFIWEVY